MYIYLLCTYYAYIFSIIILPDLNNYGIYYCKFCCNECTPSPCDVVMLVCVCDEVSPISKFILMYMYAGMCDFPCMYVCIHVDQILLIVIHENYVHNTLAKLEILSRNIHNQATNI